jgi:hypothetical protein
VFELCGLVVRYVGVADVIGVHVSGSSIEHAGLEREVHNVTSEKSDLLGTIYSKTCWLEILCTTTDTWIPIELQSQTIGDVSVFELSRMLKHDSPCIFCV